jgi:hypothetical protein
MMENATQNFKFLYIHAPRVEGLIQRTEIETRLERIKNKFGINYEILNEESNFPRTWEIYESLRKRARILRKRTGRSLSELKSASRKHLWMAPCLILFRNNTPEWWSNEREEILRILEGCEERLNFFIGPY